MDPSGYIWILCLIISFQAGSRLCMLSQEIQIEAQELRVKEVWEAWPGKARCIAWNKNPDKLIDYNNSLTWNKAILGYCSYPY